MPNQMSSLVAEYTKDWRRLQRQKQRRSGGLEARTLLNLAALFGEQYTQYDGSSLRARATAEDKNRLFLTFNLIGRACWRKMGRLWSIDNQFRATPNTTDPAAYDKADVVNDLIRAVNRKLRERQVHWNRLFWLLTSGVVIEHTPWVMDDAEEALPVVDPETGEILWEDQTTGQVIPEQAVEMMIAQGMTPERFRPSEQVQLVGEVGSELFSGLNFFIDASCTSIRKLGPDQACYLAEIKSRGWIEENFGSDAAAQISTRADLDIVKTRMLDEGATTANLSLRDLIPAIQGSREPDDPEMAIVLTRYQPRSSANPSGKRTIFTPDGVLLDDDDLPYEEIPLVDIHYRPNATTFWTGDFITDLVPAQKFLNKRMSQLGEAANAQIYEVLLLGQGLTKADIPSDLPGVVEDGLDESGNPRVKVLEGKGALPGWFVESIRMVSEFIDALGGADLLSQRKFPGQMRGPLAIPMLQEILDSEDGPLYSHLGEALAQVHQQRTNRVKQFYPPIRTLHYLGDDNRDEVLVFHTSDVLRAGFDYSISVDQGTLLPELSSLREARVRERLESPLAALYVNRRTGRMDISKIAHDLKYSDRERDSRESQYRKLARQLISRLWQGQQLDPALPMPFWDHDVMMDELEASMATTEWLDASMPVKEGFVQLYQKHQQFLQQLHEAQQQSIESSMMHSAVAQATQQAAAKAAAMATEEAMAQVRAQAEVRAPGGTAQPSPDEENPAQGIERVMAMLARGEPIP